MNSYRTLHVGMGRRGRWWLAETMKHAGFKPVASVVRQPAPADLIRKDFPNVDLPCFTSVNEAAQKLEADIAIIAAASNARVENCIEAIQAGLHILVEKPLALSLDDGRKIVELAREHKTQIVVGQNYRYEGDIAAMAKQVQERALGRIGAGSFFRSRRRFGAGTYQQTMPHSYLWEMAVHDFDVIRFTLGLKPRGVVGRSWQAPWGDFTGRQLSRHCSHSKTMST